MKLAIILDPLESIKTYKDSTYAMMRAAHARGHELYVMEQHEMVLREGAVAGFARKLDLVDDALRWYTLEEAAWHALSDFDVTLMRKDPPFDMEYIYSTYLLELAEGQGAQIFNRPAAIRDFNEKLSTAKFPEFMPPTLVTRQEALIREFIEQHGDIILKPLDGMGGSSVFRIPRNDPNLNVIIETLTQLGARTVMAQRYIPEISQGDKRILLIDGEPVPYALARIPKEGETRGNLAVGGKGVAQLLSERDREIAAALGPKLKDAGLFLVGLDVIGDWLTEINVTSPTGMQEIASQTGFDVAGMFVDALEKCVRGEA
ncbi:Glutathione synthetase [Sulfuricella denitrificans skB26]|uniref:Glutathione synthetase n=1 Tax=Sulfuricella denitrificans (strain DSM 22764 / NBRC 105220 / skB26) TaxID=1163617 RepID=S6A9D7_SULDS|nr:glutathione synthase [Sulfuricella denitrificans]BAN33930.1 Glutathione synthetase [Sulfuricella denitrificans skB26]